MMVVVVVSPQTMLTRAEAQTKEAQYPGESINYLDSGMSDGAAWNDKYFWHALGMEELN
jgi:hypothetical protein